MSLPGFVGQRERDLPALYKMKIGIYELFQMDLFAFTLKKYWFNYLINTSHDFGVARIQKCKTGLASFMPLR